MADNQLGVGDGGDGDVFVYTGGVMPHDAALPRPRVRIAENIDTIPERTFFYFIGITEVEGHDEISKIERQAFTNCPGLWRVNKMQGVKEIEAHAFYNCDIMTYVELGNLEIIGVRAFYNCRSLENMNMQSVRRVKTGAFQGCREITEAVFGKDLERIERDAFLDCTSLRRITIPLKDNLFESNVFGNCHRLQTVQIVGGIEKTISSLHVESWRDEMKEEIDRINQTLPDTRSAEKGAAIQQWIETVLNRMEHYKAEHYTLLKEAMVLLELALWKAKLEDNGSNIDAESVEVEREQHRVTCGASIVIKNVLPFLVLK